MGNVNNVVYQELNGNNFQAPVGQYGQYPQIVAYNSPQSHDNNNLQQYYPTAAQINDNKWHNPYNPYNVNNNAPSYNSNNISNPYFNSNQNNNNVKNL